MLALRFHGLDVAVQSDWPAVLEALRVDFGWFELAQAHPHVRVRIERRAPDYARHAGAACRFVTPRNVVYQRDGLTLIDYSGRALAVLDRAGGEIVIQGEDEHLVHEAAYLFVLSRVGEHLDALGLTRLHAAGLEGPDGGTAVLLPSGGGKTTLTLRALSRAPGVQLLSEDSPLVDRRGRLHPFPLRIGLNVGDVAALPDGASAHRIERPEFGPKLVLPVAEIPASVAERPVPLRHLVIGERTLGSGSSLEPLPRRAAIGPLVREGVVGLGIYQGMEFLLQRGMRDVARKTGVAAGRARCLSAALSRASVWRLCLGRDVDGAVDAIAPLLDGRVYQST